MKQEKESEEVDLKTVFSFFEMNGWSHQGAGDSGEYDIWLHKSTRVTGMWIRWQKRFQPDEDLSKLKRGTLYSLEDLKPIFSSLFDDVGVPSLRASNHWTYDGPLDAVDADGAYSVDIWTHVSGATGTWNPLAGTFTTSADVDGLKKGRYYAGAELVAMLTSTVPLVPSGTDTDGSGDNASTSTGDTDTDTGTSTDDSAGGYYSLDSLPETLEGKQVPVSQEAHRVEFECHCCGEKFVGAGECPRCGDYNVAERWNNYAEDCEEHVDGEVTDGSDSGDDDSHVEKYLCFDPPAELVRDGNSTINTTGRQLDTLVDQAWASILRYNVPPMLFQRGDRIVRVSAREEKPVQPVCHAEMLEIVSRSARYVCDGPNNQLRDKYPPVPVVNILNSTLSHGRTLPRLRSVITAPSFDARGGLLEPGYNGESGVIFLPGKNLHKIPLYNDTQHAKKLIGELLTDFWFTSEADRTAYVGLLLLPFVREMIDGVTPLHGIESYVPGAGKGLLAHLATTLAQGFPSAGTPLPPKEVEIGYTLTALISSGVQFLFLDNVSRIASSTLAAALTNHVYSGRILRTSDTLEVPMRQMWISTGNNPELSEEIARRYVRIRIEADVENPGDKPPEKFLHHPLLPWVRENRSRLIGALLTLTLSWLEAGRPPGKQTMGSFEEWATVIGGILTHHGYDDFLAQRGDVRIAASTDRTEWTAFFSAWVGVHNDAWVRVKQLLDLADTQDLLPVTLGAGNKQSRRIRLGQELSGRRDALLAGYRLHVRHNPHHKQQEYQLVADSPPLPQHEPA